MGRFIHDESKVVVSVDDSKDERFTSGWSAAPDADKPEPKAPAKKTTTSK